MTLRGVGVRRRLLKVMMYAISLVNIKENLFKNENIKVYEGW